MVVLAKQNRMVTYELQGRYLVLGQAVYPVW